MSKRTLFLIFALFVITAVLLVMALYQPSTPKPVQVTTAPKEPVAQTVLSVGSPEVATSSSVSILNYSLPININTSSNKVTAVQLELQYDPEVLTDVSIVPGSFFANPNILLNEIDPETGRISYAFGVGLDDQGVAGKGVVASLVFSAKAGVTEKTAIIFLPKTLAAAEGISESVLKEATNGLFTIGENISATPSAQ